MMCVVLDCTRLLHGRCEAVCACCTHVVLWLLLGVQGACCGGAPAHAGTPADSACMQAAAHCCWGSCMCVCVTQLLMQRTGGATENNGAVLATC